MADIARILLPRVPEMVTNTFWHSLGYLPDASKWDTKQMLAITTIKGIMSNTRSSITEQQRFSSKDPGFKANQMIIETTLPAPKDGETEGSVRTSLLRAIDELKETGDEVYDIPDVKEVEGEWQAYTSQKNPKVLVAMPPKERYAAMMAECTSPSTILYFHGGAYYLMDPKSHRGTCAKLSELNGSRSFNVRYRLAPQNPFPAALIDAFIAYLSLLYPPPGALHDPIKSEHIIFSGDSAGGNLTLVLMLFLLHLHHTGATTVLFHGKEVEVPLPAGLATNSAWCDIVHCMPSLSTNAKYDYLPSKTMTKTSHASEDTTTNQEGEEETKGTGPMPKDPAAPPPCPAWPSPPPRADLYADGTMLCHPLVSPMAAKVEHWRGVGSVFMCVGEEMLLDEGNVVTDRIYAAQQLDEQEKTGQGKGLVWEMYEAMPHVFAALLPFSKQSVRCFAAWAKFVDDAARNGRVENKGTWISAKMEAEDRTLGKLSEYGEEEVQGWMTKERDSRQRKWKQRWEEEKNGGGRT